MATSTDFNTAPYYDDYNPEKNFYRILYIPRNAVQARELTQSQTILQNQIERFGSNILVEGSITAGGNFTDLNPTPYVKILDNNTSNQPVPIGSYVGAIATGRNSGVTALVIHAVPGLEAQAPDLNTLYVRYTGTGIDALGKDVKTFIAGETLEFTFDGIGQQDLAVSVAGFGVDTAPIGNGYLVRCGDGEIYQKGFFIRFEDQITVVEKYGTSPDNKLVGFYTQEEIVNYNEDTSLLDNARGFENENAPGADRLRLVPKLVTYTAEEALADESFFAIHEYSNGALIRRNVDTQFNSVAAAMEQRTHEESGNYSLRDYNLSVGVSPGSSLNLAAQIGPGISYVNGKRVETIATTYLPVNKAAESNTVDNQNILGNYGNSISLSNVVGSFAFGTLQTVTLRDAPQTATSLVGFTAVGAAIGTARVVSYERSGNGFRIYVTDVKMNSGRSFASTRSVTSATGFSNLVLVNGSAVLSDPSLKSLVFPVGRNSIKEILTGDTSYVFKRGSTVSVPTSGTFVINLTGDEAFPYGPGVTLNSVARNDIIVSDAANGAQFSVVSAVVDANGTAMTVNIGAIPATISAQVVYNVTRTQTVPSGKDLVTVYMRINPTGALNGPYSLGWPDVYSIDGIWKGTNLTFGPTDPGVAEVTSSFNINKNMNDSYYGLSFLTKKPNTVIAAADRFLVRAKVFRRNDTGGFARSFFCVNSYPVDDVTPVLPVNRIRTEDIPVGLRDVIDFRPSVTPLSAYSTGLTGNTVWTNANKLETISFGSDSLNLIAPNQVMDISYSYYLSRIDKIVIDSEGIFSIIMGEPAINPVPPNHSVNSMVIAEVNVPAFPTLTPAVANRKGIPGNAVTLRKHSNRRYTMRDIDRISKRIDSLEYYTTLNNLEKSAESMVILDSDGNNRFKNGIFTESFDSLLNSEINDPNFAASVDPGENELTPRFRQYNMGLKVASTPAGMKTNKVVIPAYTQKSIIDQPYATSFRNTVTDFYSFKGQIALSPEYDGAFDTTVAPDVSISLDLESAFSEFADALNEFVPLSSSESSTQRESTLLGSTTSSETSTSSTVVRRTTTTTTTTTDTTQITDTTTTNTKSLSVDGSTNTQRVGDFITDINFSPYLKARDVKISAVGMRPNVQVWFYFDGVDVSGHCAQGAFDENPDNVSRTGKFGEVIRTNGQGCLGAIFRIPAETFYTGDRILVVTDVNSLESITAATTNASATYRGFNFSVEKTGLEVSTRTPDFGIDADTTVMESTWIQETSQVTTSTAVTSIPREIGGSGNGRSTGRGDPISQTFFVERNMTASTHVMISSIDVAFEKKSLSNAIRLELRETVNGYPGKKIFSFGKKRLSPTQIGVSPDGTAWTRFNFDVPVTLAPDTEYCFVLIPDGNDPDYRVWIARVGEKDKSLGIAITQDTNPGTLFTSTNDSAWTPHQNENMKYRVNKAVYPKGIFNVTLIPDSPEFFEIGTYSAKFRSGETVFKVNPNAAGTVSIVAGSNVVNGTGTGFTTSFAVGDPFAISIGNGYEISTVASIESPTRLTLSEVMTDTASGRNYFKTVTGILDSAYYTDPVGFSLRGSTAKAGLVFSDGDTIRGEISNSLAVISQVFDLPVSYIQPNIYRASFGSTSTSLNLTRRLVSSGISNVVQKIPFNDNSYLTNGALIGSKSNDIRRPTPYSFSLNAVMDNSSSADVFPYVDHEIASVSGFRYFINQGTEEILDAEKLPNPGIVGTRWISKMINLRDGFDAEDLKVWLTGYRPTGSDISVYVRFISSSDPGSPITLPWTRLIRAGSSNFFSSSVNRYDWKEFEYSLGTEVLGNGEGAYIGPDGSFEYKDSSGAVYSDFKRFMIKIVLSSNNHGLIPRVNDLRAIALT